MRWRAIYSSRVMSFFEQKGDPPFSPLELSQGCLDHCARLALRKSDKSMESDESGFRLYWTDARLLVDHVGKQFGQSVPRDLHSNAEQNKRNDPQNAMRS